MQTSRHTTLPPPYLRRVWLDEEADIGRDVRPFVLLLFRRRFQLDLDLLGARRCG